MNQQKTNLFIPQANSSLTEWLYYIQNLHSKPIDLSLDRIRCVATNLNLLKPAPLVITVGGTNGKGTTCRLLEAILLYHGLQVGVFSSPHLLSYTERVRINGRQLIDTDHSKAMSVIETGRNDISLSYFEFSTLSTLQLFCQAMLDVVILEVGLGGRLDATNIIDADIAVITNIALDHTNLLGLDRDSIAREKAGIMRYGKPLIIGDSDRPIILDLLAANNNVMLFARDRDWGFSREKSNYWTWWGLDLELKKLPLPAAIPLDNAATALAVLCYLPIKVGKDCIHQGLQYAMLPGRFQIICKQPLVILDVAHNPHAANYLAYQLENLPLPKNSRIRAVVGMRADKDLSGTLNYLRDKVDIWYCATIPDQNAASAEELAALLDSNTQKFQDIASAWRQVILDAAPEDCILVFGSFHTVASVIRENLSN
ncbi:bifunctional tetrahydrofolate synthase/dihydrofolate synthase [Candidatus Palibaumannia cicadellinicola]|uniref:Dihydrofolate synthase/folylpolyglutamate synthase n=1 Tax=Baumannia cicadellinicola subsp. Homalodisca coagulata TaxID=374463 RepID=Q1LTA4_BAUCH|nr:bifunctional tetrahydrofolate synthase/dihydrofolate synthase [Candidatus Baumannia cicadellinicola]ABF14128.1 dihydrofolate:folylpolyglutamate synthetase [Baumannia cicadellinicola str. Hc (Homalodisca coagulata)]MCJ7462208.1 bifunctional tetrahydrofolate synthase/dihydrofolate synthase [Candidatus Baumannia cicadellinicola]MCJ7462726.1 bifunctional tetrahydrofolate synthase/dihydrofolate synthase [Candidatus Baumannia cicadellinicola]